MWHVWGNIQRLSNTKRGLFGTIQAKAGSGAGGAWGIRTPDPLNAIEMLSLLSYSPTAPISKIVAGRQTSDAGCPDPATRTTVQLLSLAHNAQVDRHSAAQSPNPPSHRGLYCLATPKPAAAVTREVQFSNSLGTKSVEKLKAIPAAMAATQGGS